VFVFASADARGPGTVMKVWSSKVSLSAGEPDLRLNESYQNLYNPPSRYAFH
jgi:hypothetical protein